MKTKTQNACNGTNSSKLNNNQERREPFEHLQAAHSYNYAHFEHIEWMLHELRRASGGHLFKPGAVPDSHESRARVNAYLEAYERIYKLQVQANDQWLRVCGVAAQRRRCMAADRPADERGSCFAASGRESIQSGPGKAAIRTGPGRGAACFLSRGAGVGQAYEQPAKSVLHRAVVRREHLEEIRSLRNVKPFRRLPVQESRSPSTTP
jgi:hypothetical protein